MQTRYVGLGGPMAKKPRVLRTCVGADLSVLVEGETKEGDVRVASGSVLNGRKMEGPFGYLGAFHNQVSLIAEGKERKLLGWHMPGFDQYSVKRVFASKLLGRSRFPMSASTHGSKRALVPFGHFETVCAFDTLATQLLRALITRDTDSAQELGVLELGEEDMALFTFVSTGKTDFGPILRDNLDLIEKEG